MNDILNRMLYEELGISEQEDVCLRELFDCIAILFKSRGIEEEIKGIFQEMQNANLFVNAKDVVKFSLDLSSHLTNYYLHQFPFNYHSLIPSPSAFIIECVVREW